MVIFKMLILLLVFAMYTECHNIKLEMELLNSGFHRILTYLLNFNDEQYKNCEYYVKQNLPSSVFINCDELNDLQRLNKLDVIHPHHVDVEIPTEKAKPISVLIHGISDIDDKNKKHQLPIHFRYHAPSTKGFVKVELDHPFIFINCKGIIHNISNENSIKYCFNGIAFNQITIKNSNENCNWIIIDDYELQLKTPLKINIPIGDKRFFKLFEFVTIFVSWIGVACIIFTLNKKMEKLQKKLK